MTQIRAVVLDFDGLILETESACYGGWRALFREHQADYALHEYQQILGSEEDPRALFEQRCGRPADWSALERRRREVENELNATLAVQPGVVALLDQAAALGLRIGIASSSPHRWVDRHLATHELFDRFDTIVCRDDVARAKPAPDLYLEALRRLDVAGAAAVAFEDSHHGSLAAVRAGLRCVVVPTAMTATQDFSHADLSLLTLANLELPELFQRFLATPRPRASSAHS
jgi:putative hydrolase of the HAD superfamily